MLHGAMGEWPNMPMALYRGRASPTQQQHHRWTARETLFLGKQGGVEAGYKGRARRGKEKEGGYDQTPNRRGPRKAKGARIRYVEDDERGGGTTEQGIRMGPVSVQRVAKGRGRPRMGAATPLRDPG